MESKYPSRRILLLEGVSLVAKEAFEKEGYEVKYYSGTIPREELVKEIKDVHFVGIRSKTVLDYEILELATKLQCIGCFCIGTDRVDLEHAASLGIVVFNSPFCNSRSVAELVIHYIVGLSRHLGDKNREMHKAVWKKTANGCFEIRGKTLGIVGYGHVGMQVSVLAEAMGMRVIYYDVVSKLPLGNANSCPDLNTLLSESDFVTLHVPATPETKLMIEKEQFENMKDGSYLINASRGNVVDIKELCKALESQKLAGAAIDVFPCEPISKENRDIERLLECANVILTPHIGGSTIEAQTAIGKEVSDRYINYVNYGITEGCVNFPEVSMSYKPGTARICNVHQSKPGVLAEINKVISEYNIVQQTLNTRGNIGYLVCDLEDVADGVDFKKKLQELQNSIRTRIRVHK